MFDSRYSGFTICENRAPLCINDLFSDSIDNWLIFKVDTLYLVAGVLGSRIESDGET
ncbi:hypothetical protein HMPREF1146_1963 [Prevotella sp. MSX73]|nr:hypothetical protein HMPREF1146_1963 [Prevotella sp. MSX73]